jgi:hypothetical protein
MMKSRHHILTTALLATGLGACSVLLGSGPHVPGAFQGTTKITVANASDAEMCAFTLLAGDGKPDNWLGEKSKLESVAPGGQRSFDIKPGTYHVVAGLFLPRARGGSCQGGEFLAAAGTKGPATVDIKGPSLITIGPRATAPIEGMELIAFPNYVTERFAGGGAAQAPAADEAAPAAEAPACKGVGADVKGFDECCSGKDRSTTTAEHGGPYKCCESGDGCH